MRGGGDGGAHSVGAREGEGPLALGLGGSSVLAAVDGAWSRRQRGVEHGVGKRAGHAVRSGVAEESGGPPRTHEGDLSPARGALCDWLAAASAARASRRSELEQIAAATSLEGHLETVLCGGKARALSSLSLSALSLFVRSFIDGRAGK